MNKHMKILALFCLLAAACAPVSGPNSGLRPATLPPATTVSAPDASVPAEFAAFSGIWQGTWGASLDGKLAVTSVGADGATDVVYAWGENPGRFDPGFLETQGKIDNGVLTLATFGNGAKVTYAMSEDGSLSGKYLLNGRTTSGIFRKTE